MADPLRKLFLRTSGFAYSLVRPLLFRRSAQHWHETMQYWLARWDDNIVMQQIIKQMGKTAFAEQPVTVGGVRLPHPFMLAAGFVKGHGFATEQDALAASRGQNIIPGWRSMPHLVGPVEFGSFTRHPRTGNPGTVIWRHPMTTSTQNRVGLRNPGAVAAAAFLTLKRQYLPQTFGVNIAVSPGVEDVPTQQREIIEAVEAFIGRGVQPTWFTLNISCPNTEDDPGDNQTENGTRALCEAVVGVLRQRSGETGREIPLWVKVGPGLAESQYHTLVRVFAETGVRAVIATNTLPQPAPDQPAVMAGVGGGGLHQQAVTAARHLVKARDEQHVPLDVIGCGGIQDPASYHAFTMLGVQAVQYWSALIYGGPFVAAAILDETRQ